MKTTVSFPGLGIEEFTMDRAAIHLTDDWSIYWYAVIIVTGMVLAFVHAYIRVRQEGIKTDDILDIGIATVFTGVIGARLYYIIFDFLENPHNYKSFKDFIAIWEGGLAIYGGIIGGVLAIIAVSLFKRLNVLKVMDCIAPGVMLAQAFGRWGNFVNGEAHGGIVSENSPLYFLRMGLYEGGQLAYYHPTFLYESLWNLIGFTLITIFYRKKKFNGQIVLSYFAWYGFGRMFIEGMRTDSLWWGPFRVSQLIGGICFVLGTAALVAGFILTRKGLLKNLLTVKWAVPANESPAAAPAEAPAETDTYTPVFSHPETDDMGEPTDTDTPEKEQ